MAPDLSDPKIINADDIADGVLDPNFNWDRAIPAPGHTGVDFEERVNFRRLHDYRLARARQAIGGFQAAVSTGRIFEPARLEFEIVIDAT